MAIYKMLLRLENLFIFAVNKIDPSLSCYRDF